MLKKWLEKNPHKQLLLLKKKPIFDFLCLSFITFPFNVGESVYAQLAVYSLKTCKFYSTVFSYGKGFVNNELPL